MSDAFPLPARPNLEQYKKLAKDLQCACESGDPGAFRDWAARWAEKIARLQGMDMARKVKRQVDGETKRIEHRWMEFHKENERAAKCALADAQCFVARAHGFTSWPKFVSHLEGLARAQSPVSQFEAAVDAIVSGDSASLNKLLWRIRN